MYSKSIRNENLSINEIDFLQSVNDFRLFDNHQLINLILHGGEYHEKDNFDEISELVIQYLELKSRELPVARSEEKLYQLGIKKKEIFLLKAATELYRRILYPNATVINSPRDLYKIMLHFAYRPEENFYLITLNAAQEIIGQHHVSRGSLMRTEIHPREIFFLAIKDRSASIIIMHNHPSGNINPSEMDVDTTERIEHAGKLMGIPLVDHIIFTPDKYYSFFESGKMSIKDSKDYNQRH